MNHGYVDEEPLISLNKTAEFLIEKGLLNDFFVWAKKKGYMEEHKNEK